MGALKLCTYKKAEYPLYLEMLSLHVYTMEELCYAMESSLFLLDESWMGTEFFQWIAEGVGNAELAGQLRRLYQRHRDVYECAAFLFSASGFYSRQEQKELERIIEKMKERTPWNAKDESRITISQKRDTAMPLVGIWNYFSRSSCNR